ncbi:sulfurtransferase [Tumidithrix elongata RA019]|uniref:Sulfurtransferase n=1 Tax=Tumidithrix elongata BACA0141 TaxID=2716417 RepID=A0AAW9PQY1_9CYAN|nr:sulfurtransferase [Tumidithrix elongata RA019]
MKRKSIWKKSSRLKPLVLLASVIACFVAIAAFNFSPLAAQNSGTKISFVPPSWVRDRSNDPNLRILDVRLNPVDYFKAHVPNAVNFADNLVRGPKKGLPVQYFEPEKLETLLEKAGVTDNTQVLIYSDGRDVLGATQIAYLLERVGLRQPVAVLDGGLTGYIEAKEKVTQEFPKYEIGNLTLKDNKSIRVNLDQVKELIGKPNVVFLDPRPPKAFRGEEGIFARDGHIPGAKNIPWVTFTYADKENPHKLKPLSDIQKILTDRKIDKSKDIIVTCTTGREATLQYVVLKHLLGYPKVRVYEGSFTEYSQSGLPVETGPERST